MLTTFVQSKGQPNRYPPWFEKLSAELRRDDSPYIKPLPPHVKLSKQQAGRYAESLFRNEVYKVDPVTLLPMVKEVLQKARIVLFVDSTIKSSSNMNYNLLDVRVRIMPYSTLEKMTEGMCKVFGPAGT